MARRGPRREARRRPRFRTIDHTADIGLAVWGRSLPDLFANAAAGMFYLLYPGRRGAAGGRRLHFELAESDPVELLVAWLRELLYVHEDDSLYLGGFDVRLERGRRLRAECCARPADLTRRQYEIKLVTYHGLAIEKVDDLYRVRIIFDI